MRILIGCEFSGIVRDAFRARGHDAWSCDLSPTEREGPHIQDDLFNVLQRLGTYRQLPRDWKPDLMIFHWPCTYLTRAGALWLFNAPKRPKPGVLYGEARRREMLRHAGLFRDLLYWPGIPRIAGENPIPYRDARNIMLNPTQVIQPWMFGTPETKATCLWLRGLPELTPTNIVAGPHRARVHREPPGPERWKNRSRTDPNVAAAMAEQWGAEPTTKEQP